MKMKNIGLLTCFLDNCGACLQAYALQKTINSFGCTCVIVKYVEPNGYDKRTWPRKFFAKIVKNQFFLWALSPFSASFRKRYFEKKRSIRFQKFRDKWLIFTRKSFYSYQELEKYKFDFDAFVAGSDQIWNPTFYDGNNRAYFLDFASLGIPRIAYAPSIGISAMPREYSQDFSLLLNKFTCLSAREEQGVEIISKYTSKKCSLVCDPTLLLTGEQWAAAFGIQQTKKITFFYIYLAKGHII
jgi:hypothetical protein